jgi:hypothetical protein
MLIFYLSFLYLLLFAKMLLVCLVSVTCNVHIDEKHNEA